MAKKKEKKHGNQDPKRTTSKPTSIKTNQKKTNVTSWIVFLFTLSIVLISLVSVIFPAIISSGNSTIEILKDLDIVDLQIDHYETGVWSGGLITTNFIIFGLLFLYYKKKLPEQITKVINFIFNIEVSKKLSAIVVMVLLVIYVVATAQELATEESWDDYIGVKKRLQTWKIEDVAGSFEPHVNYFLLVTSMDLFGNYMVIPLLGSVALLLLTYFFTLEITKKRFAGIVALVVLMQSMIFLIYDTSVAYTNFWTLFYVLSLYLIYKGPAWPLSPISHVLSMASKALSAVFLPMSVYFILRSEIPKRRKIITSLTITVLVIGAAIGATALNINLYGVTGGQERFIGDEFWQGFTSFSYQLRFDGLVLLFLLPLVVGLFIASKYGINHAESMLVLIGGMLLIAPILTGISTQTNQPYRFIPLVVFFATGVGILLSKQTRK